MKFLIFTLVTAFLQASAWAAIPSKSISHQGGIAGSGFSILDAGLISAKNKERIVLSIGDQDGKRFLGRPGYYFAEYKPQTQELRVDFSQILSSRIQEEQLVAKLKKAKLVQKSEMILDPIDSTLQMKFKLSPGTKVKFYEVKGKKQTAKVVIDITKVTK
ncbi:MAG: hypothetical protein ACLGGX_04490 [Bdellovibrionia bacterium]